MISLCCILSLQIGTWSWNLLCYMSLSKWHGQYSSHFMSRFFFSVLYLHRKAHALCTSYSVSRNFRWEQLHRFSFKPLKYIYNCPCQISGHGVWSTSHFSFAAFNRPTGEMSLIFPWLTISSLLWSLIWLALLTWPSTVFTCLKTETPGMMGEIPCASQIALFISWLISTFLLILLLEFLRQGQSFFQCPVREQPKHNPGFFVSAADCVVCVLLGSIYRFGLYGHAL